MEQDEDRVINAIIDCIVEFRVRYGYARKLDDPELHQQLVTILQKEKAADRIRAYNQEMDERNRIAYENRPKPWQP